MIIISIELSCLCKRYSSSSFPETNTYLTWLILSHRFSFERDEHFYVNQFCITSITIKTSTLIMNFSLIQNYISWWRCVQIMNIEFKNSRNSIEKPNILLYYSIIFARISSWVLFHRNFAASVVSHFPLNAMQTWLWGEQIQRQWKLRCFLVFRTIICE